jgi:5-methyltetrahydrofolate--homocysteine methyltransferase
MLDGLAAMQKFIKIAVTEPEVSKRPFMIDSSKFDIVEAGLKWCQGKPIINSISLKVGEAEFIRHANIIRKHGAAVVIMAFDEQGQAATYEDKVKMCQRSYRLLREQLDFNPHRLVTNCRRETKREARGRDRREKALTRVGDKKELVSPPRVQEKGFEELKKIC